MEKKVRIIKYKFSFREKVKIVFNFILCFICLSAIGFGIYLAIRTIPMYKDYYIVQGNPFSFPKLILYIVCTILIFGFTFMDGLIYNALMVSIIALVIFFVFGNLLYNFICNIKDVFELKKKIDANPIYYGYYEFEEEITPEEEIQFLEENLYNDGITYSDFQ